MAWSARGAWLRDEDESGPELADAVNSVRDGDAVFSPRLAGFVSTRSPGSSPRPRTTPSSTSSPREREVLRLIGGATSTRRSRASSRSRAKTVKSHAATVLRKLQLSSRHELSHWAVERRLVD